MRFVDEYSPILRVLRAIGAALVVVAVVRQLFIVYDQPEPQPDHLFSFFTIQANLLAAAVWAAGAWRPALTADRPGLRGAATSYLAITGLVYIVLSFGQNKDEYLQITAWWVDALTHQILPLAALIEWVFVAPRRRIGARVSLTWLLYPIAFFFLTMIRGFFTGWYPYAFLRPGIWHGYSGVLVNALIVLAIMTPTVLAIGWIGSRRAADRPAGEGRADGSGQVPA